METHHLSSGSLRQGHSLNWSVSLPGLSKETRVSSASHSRLCHFTTFFLLTNFGKIWFSETRSKSRHCSICHVFTTLVAFQNQWLRAFLTASLWILGGCVIWELFFMAVVPFSFFRINGIMESNHPQESEKERMNVKVRGTWSRFFYISPILRVLPALSLQGLICLHPFKWNKLLLRRRHCAACGCGGWEG